MKQYKKEMRLSFAKKNLKTLAMVGRGGNRAYYRGCDKSKISTSMRKSIFSVQPNTFFKQLCVKDKFLIKRSQNGGVDYYDASPSDNVHYGRLSEVNAPIEGKKLYNVITREMKEWEPWINGHGMRLEILPMTIHLAKKIYGYKEFRAPPRKQPQEATQ